MAASASRLKPMAALRAATIATTTQSTTRAVTGAESEANATLARAKGSAKTEWENRTILPKSRALTRIVLTRPLSCGKGTGLDTSPGRILGEGARRRRLADPRAAAAGRGL
jgi:hypothetical protein